MTNVNEVQARSAGKCELCACPDDLAIYEVPFSPDEADNRTMLCANCRHQIENPDAMDVKHWRCLSESMWSTAPAVQVMAWRLLKRLDGEHWAQELLDMLYLDETVQAWAGAGIESDNGEVVPTKDCNGAILQSGDTVSIIKDLDVKGTSFTAKRGTAVRNIALTDNPEHIEGRVNGTRIVLLTRFVKKI